VLGARLSAGAGHPLASPGTVRRFTSRVGSASSRALGWDTMLPTSSCGTQMSPEAFGHTGFTGTSLWIEPRAGIYVALLTNRVYPAPGTSDGITAFRRAVHDAVMTDWKMKA
jgi:CubicO group peptidase (beta-lactamase class C family)